MNLPKTTAIVALMSSILSVVAELRDFGYHECVYNTYKAVCLGNYVELNRERRGLYKFPTVSRETCIKLKTNAIERFPDNLDTLKNVVTLDLSNNRISALPDGLDKMSSLQILDVSNNKLNTLSTSTRFPASLHGLLLAGNKMTTIPAGVKVPQLFVLDLSHNSFADIPDTFCISDQLIRVDFTNNPLKKDLSHYVNTANKCKNVKNIPYCLFIDKANIRCDCSTLGPVVSGIPSFCMGTPLRNQEMRCSTADSLEKYKGKKLFDVNVTHTEAVCPYKAPLTEDKKSGIGSQLIAGNLGLIALLLFAYSCAR